MRVKATTSVVLAALMTLAPVLSSAQFTNVVASGVADGEGACAIDIPVDSAADPQFVADELKEYLQLSGGASLQSISVENGIAHIECADAAANSTVEASLPADIASSIGAPGGAPGAPAEGGGVSTVAVAGGVGLAAVAAGLGVCAGTGCFDGDDDDEIPVISGER
jgi:hypothetical protein